MNATIAIQPTHTLRKLSVILALVLGMLAVSLAPSVSTTSVGAAIPDSVASVVDSAFGVQEAEAGFWGAVAGAFVQTVTVAATAAAWTTAAVTAPAWVPVAGAALGIASIVGAAYIGYHAF